MGPVKDTLGRHVACSLEVATLDVTIEERLRIAIIVLLCFPNA